MCIRDRGNIRFIETSEAKIWKDDTCPAGLAVFGTLVLLSLIHI